MRNTRSAHVFRVSHDDSYPMWTSPAPALRVHKDSDTMLPALFPLAIVGPAVGPREGALPRLPVVHKAALIEAAIRPGHRTRAMHLRRFA